MRRADDNDRDSMRKWKKDKPMRLDQSEETVDLCLSARLITFELLPIKLIIIVT